MPQPRNVEPEPTPADRRSAQAAVAAVAAAVAAGAAAPKPDLRPLTLPLVSADHVARMTAVVVGLMAQYTEQRKASEKAFLLARLAPRTSTPTDVETVMAEEEVRGLEFARLAEQRVRRDLPVALAIPDPAEREKAVNGVMAREAHYQRMRAEAMAARSFAAVDRMVLRRESPTGAFWLLDPTVKEHTAGCLILGGRFWPWSVLDRVHPPRHAGCPCRLISYGEAVKRGLLLPGTVMDEAMAIKAAASVVMEAELALAESESWRGQPRDLGGEGGGQWTKGGAGAKAAVAPKLADVGERMATAALAWNARSGIDVSKAPPRAQIVANWTKQFRGRLSKDREALRLIADAEVENGRNAIWQKVVAKLEPDHVFVTTPHEKGKSTRLIDTEGAAHRLAGSTVITDESVHACVKEAVKDPQGVRAEASSGYGLAALLRHEYGHSVDGALPKGVRKAIIGAIPEPGADLSYYAGWHAAKGNDGEVIPELLALVTHPRYRPQDWPQTVQTAGKLLLAAVS